MKEVYLYRTTENELATFKAESLIELSSDKIWRDCMFIAFYTEESNCIKAVARVVGVTITGEHRAAEIGQPVGLKIMIGEPIKLVGPVEIKGEGPLPEFISFEDVLRAKEGFDRTQAFKNEPSPKEKKILVQRYMEQAINLSVLQRLDDALKLFNNALDLDRENHLLFFYLGNVHVDKGKYDLAIYYYRKSLALNKSFAPAIDYLGLAYALKQQPDSAIAVWEKARELNPRNEFALVNLGKIYVQKREYEKAIDVLKFAVEVNSNNFFAMNLLGVAYANKGELDKAIEMWTKIIESGQEDEHLRLNLARAYTESGRLKEALEVYEHLQEIFPKEHEIHKIAEAMINEIQFRLSKATDNLKTAAELADFVKSHFGIKLVDFEKIGEIKFSCSKFVEYLRRYNFREAGVLEIHYVPEADSVSYDSEGKKAVLDPESVKTTVKLRSAMKKISMLVEKASSPEGERKIRTIHIGGGEEEIPPEKLEELQAALERAQEMVASEPKNEWAHYSLGSVLAQMGHFENALAEFKIASAINPNNAIALYALGLCYVRLGQLDEAIKALQAAIIASPDGQLTRVYEEWNYKDSLAYFALGDVYIRKGMFQEAIGIFKKGLSIDATSALAHFQLGTCYDVLGEYDRAIDAYTNAIHLAEDFAYAYSKLGIIYLKQNRLDEALMMLVKAVSFENADNESHFYLAETYLKLGRLEEARHAYRIVIQMGTPEDIFSRKAAERLKELA